MPLLIVASRGRAEIILIEMKLSDHFTLS